MKQNYIVKLINLFKAFGPKVISKDLNLSIIEGEFLAIIGRSGEGKSVLLKQMIGLITPDSGTVIVDGVDLTALKDVREHDKVFQSCGYVFQFAALLDSLTVAENVGITLFEEGKSLKEVLPLVRDKLVAVGLDPAIANRYPSELSGGMKKRVGLARTLMRSPKILIYDEPTTGLDPISVRMIHELMRTTHDANKTTTVVISHDPDVFNYADRVAMLHEGRILYIGDAKTIWQETNPYIYQFIRGLSEGPITMASEKVK
ncbi:MAG: phospholipid/cholesterol/gamma-HCH transport system ATP-binding protein [Candidatus Dependentiae bacterium]|nr:phospholipid/cholesterol/gamma-HCH transport system ATP-binding protein [Candidatus Dependentiae bacterium]